MAHAKAQRAPKKEKGELNKLLLWEPLILPTQNHICALCVFGRDNLFSPTGEQDA
jgi:hypothetical protein